MKPFKWILDSPHLRLETQLTAEEFTSLFAQCVDPPRNILIAAHTESSRIMGTLNGRRFRLQEHCSYRNSGLPYFYGQIESAASGSEILGRFSVHPSMKAFMLIWFAMALMFSAVLGIIVTEALIGGNRDAIWGVLTSLAVVVFLSLAAVFMRVIGKRKEEMYLAFFREKFGASLLDRRE